MKVRVLYSLVVCVVSVCSIQAAQIPLQWQDCEAEHWQPHTERFPNGFQPVVDYARQNGVALGLWFTVSSRLC